MSQLKLFLFGPPRLERDGHILEISLRKALALLSYLAVTRQAHSREALAALFWPEYDQRSARNNLRRALHQLNQLLRDELIVTPETVSLKPQAELWLDIEQYQQHVAACLPPALPLSAGCLQRLVEAVDLYSADFLAGFTLPDCPEFDEWQFFQSESLRQSLAQLLEQLGAAHQSQGEFEPALLYTRRWLALEPLHEPAQRRLMALYDQSGQPGAALRQYEAYARLLEEELGLPPGEETITLYEAIKAKQRLSPFVKAVGAPAGETAPPGPAGSPPKTQYVRSGEVHIAYQVLGQGPVDLIFINGFVSHLEQMWEEPALARFWRQVAAFARLILFDKRGVGLSERVGYPPTLEHTMDDVLAVMAAVGAKQPVLWGVSEGGPNSALFAATYPERVSGLILYGTTAKFTRSPDYPWALTREQFDRWLAQLVEHWGEPTGLETFAPSRTEDKIFREWWARSLRLASSPGGIKAVLEVARDIDIRHILPAIHVPTLSLHRSGDRAIRLGAGQALAQRIPGARWVELPGDDHWWWLGETAPLLLEIEQFLAGVKQPAPANQILATLLSASFSQAGAEGQALPASLQAQIVEEIARFRGQLANQGPGHLLATFDGPSRAIRCALALRGLAQWQGLSLKAGLHAGECELVEGEPRGVVVHLVEGTRAKAGANEILISSTVKELVTGAGFILEERGRYTFEGVQGEWLLFSL